MTPHRVRAGLLAAVLTLMTSFTTAGCAQIWEALGTDPERYSAACALAVDGSGSAEAAPRGFGARAKLETALPDFLAETDCRTLAFAPITHASEGSLCQKDTLDLDPEADATSNRDQVRDDMRVVAQGLALELLDCARQHDSGSDVLGALARIADARPADGESFHILVVSDFVQWDAGLTLPAEDLTTADSRAAIIDELEAQGRLPRLAGATVYPAGFGMRYSEQPDAYQDFEAFWTELLEGRVKANVDSAHHAQ